MTPSEAPLRKGLVRCEKCLRVVRPAARKTPHTDTAECKAAQIAIAYHERGWMQVSNVTLSKIVEESGAPFEWALAGTHAEVEPERFNEHGVCVKPARTIIVRHKVGFAPQGVIAAAARLARIRLASHYRRRAIFALWDQPELLDAIDTVQRMDGDIQAAIYQAVTTAEDRKGVER